MYQHVPAAIAQRLAQMCRFVSTMGLHVNWSCRHVILGFLAVPSTHPAHPLLECPLQKAMRNHYTEIYLPTATCPFEQQMSLQLLQACLPLSMERKFHDCSKASEYSRGLNSRMVNSHEMCNDLPKTTEQREQMFACRCHV